MAFDALIAESRNFFLGAVESAPTDANARFRLGNFYQTLEKFDDAEKCYRAAAALDNAHVDAMNNLAMILQERGGDAVDEAEAYYLRCVEVDPKYVARHVSTDVRRRDVQLGDVEAAVPARSRRVPRPHQQGRGDPAGAERPPAGESAEGGGGGGRGRGGGVRGPVVTDARPRRTDPERDKCIR
eukprot:30917-Pelagococcus_subviridis.AAC.1